ncbi:MAG TPA: hypothetical protein VGZ27_03590 [Vicinamibacterales bacterium]|nr:hypothetical protein [Vicinamibacterales bacterium]
MLLIAALPALALAQSTGGMESDQLPSTFTLSTNPHTLNSNEAAAGGGVLGRRSNGGLLGIDSVVNWSSYFYYPGFDGNGNPQFTWNYTMVGHSPLAEGDDNGDGGRTTRIRAPIVPVIVDLRNYDGSPRFVGGQPLISDPTKYVAPVLNSPVFSNALYDSSEDPTQFTDAVQRAEFFHDASDDWHTILKQRVATTRTMVLIRGTYQFALNKDGTCCRFILVDYATFVNALFPPTATDTSTPMGAAEHAGDVTTKDISTFLFPNTYLYLGSLCCVLGFHSYDLEPGDASNGFRERRYVMNYSSWISPGLFKGGFADITALSHEMAETFNDPFVNNATPWWLAPNGNCQNNLETGDVIEGLSNAIFPIALNGSMWSPQNEALLEWFANQRPSSAIHNAYSYPNISVLPVGATSQFPGCTPALPPPPPLP